MFPSCISSSLDICHFTCAFSCFPSRSSRSVLPILASFLTFLRVFLDSLRLLLLAFFGRSVSVFPAYFHSNPLSTSWTITISSGWRSFGSAGVLALRVEEVLQNTESYCSTTISSVWFRAQNAGCKLFAYAASNQLVHVKPSCYAQTCAHGTLP